MKIEEMGKKLQQLIEEKSKLDEKIRLLTKEYATATEKISKDLGGDKPSTEQRLENGIRHQPNRYIVTRYEDGKIYSVVDTDTGRLWIKVKGGFIWID